MTLDLLHNITDTTKNIHLQLRNFIEMNLEEFSTRGKEAVDYICKYLSEVDNKRVLTDFEPGFIYEMIPEDPPQYGESWDDIMKDLDRVIVPGLNHWQHTHFHAYYPSGNSFPSILGETLVGAIGSPESTKNNPSTYDLEKTVTNWIAKAMELPKYFLNASDSPGAGFLYSSASETVFTIILCAKHRFLEMLMKDLDLSDFSHESLGDQDQILRYAEAHINSRLVGYYSVLANSCVEKGCMMANINFRQLQVTKDDYAVTGEILEKQIKKDLKDGLYPCVMVATLGTTACCSYDRIYEIGQICKKYQMYLHVDAAYAGASLICPEYRYLNHGLEFADSLEFNTNKYFLVNFECTVFWVKNKKELLETMNPHYSIDLEEENDDSLYTDLSSDFKNYSLTSSRRNRSLKLWFTIRKYGLNGLKAYIRNHVERAKQFASLVESDQRFELLGQPNLGLVSFKIKNKNNEDNLEKDNLLNKNLLELINESGKMYMIPGIVHGIYFIRFVANAEHINAQDINNAWNMIKHYSNLVVTTEQLNKERRESIRRFSDISVILEYSLNIQDSFTDQLIEEYIDNYPEVEHGKKFSLCNDNSDI